VIVVAIYNMKGGVGKSTTAVNLAYSAAASGARTLLWDLDAQAASSFAFRVHPEVEGFGKKSLRQIDTLTAAIKATDYDNLDLLPADFAYRKLDLFLERLGRPDRDLAEALQKLGRGYGYVLLDCPPGLSMLSENVFAAADLILVPTIPTVLSLRTLSRLFEHVGHRGNETKMSAFLSMVDRRKALHRQVCEWALQYPEFFLSAQVPYASAIEQMSVRRMPLAAVVPEDAATSAFNSLWCNLKARLANQAPAANSEPRRSAAFAKAIVDLIVKLGGETDDGAVPDEPPPDLAVPVPSPEEQAGTHRIRLEVSGEDAFESLGLKPSAGTPVGTTRLAHIFDTDDGVLLRDGYLLQLLEEPGAFAVALETLQRSNGTVYQHEGIQVATIDRRWAADILAGCLSPIKVLERRLGPPLPKLISSVATAAGKQPVQRVTWRRRLRRHLGPILLPYDKTRVTLNFEFDKISGPDSKVDYEIEATATGLSARSCEQTLRQLLSHAGINWQPLTDRYWPVPSNGKNGHHKLTTK
jgi:cellulose biosynthesis protein BcsQ